MENLIIYLITLIAGVLVIFLARWSRKRFEEKYGQVTAKEKRQSLIIFIIWLALFALGLFVFPTYFGWFYIIILVLGVPFILEKPSRKLSWRIQESGFFAFIMFGPIAGFYYFG